jgi:hypothetical protein
MHHLSVETIALVRISSLEAGLPLLLGLSQECSGMDDLKPRDSKPCSIVQPYAGAKGHTHPSRMYCSMARQPAIEKLFGPAGSRVTAPRSSI